MVSAPQDQAQGAGRPHLRRRAADAGHRPRPDDPAEAEAGISFLLAEQNINVALRHAHYAYVLENGRVADEGTPDSLAARENIHSFYLGGTGA